MHSLLRASSLIGRCVCAQYGQFNSTISLKKLKIYTDPSEELKAPSRVYVFSNLNESMKEFSELIDLVEAPPKPGAALKFWGRELTNEEVNGRFIDLTSVYRYYRNVHSLQVSVP